MLTQIVIKGDFLQNKSLKYFILDKINDLKGQNIVYLDVQGKSIITDCIIVCTGTSSRHVKSIADYIMKESRTAGLIPLSIEGNNIADWIIVDFGEIIVHIMQKDSRNMYEIEKLWS